MLIKLLSTLLILVLFATHAEQVAKLNQLPDGIVVQFKTTTTTASEQENETFTADATEYTLDLEEGLSAVLHASRPLSEDLPSTVVFDTEIFINKTVNILSSEQAFSEEDYIAQLKKIINKLLENPNVAWAEPNFIYSLPDIEVDENKEKTKSTEQAEETIMASSRYIQTNDPYKFDLWGLARHHSHTKHYGISANDAWSLTKGKNIFTGKSINVAVIDSGIIFEHPDIKNQLITDNRFSTGYVGADLIEYTEPFFQSTDDISRAQDKNGQDDDPSDPGDWSNKQECDSSELYGRPSSWHGLHVTGIIAATANNNEGIAGVAPEAQIIPVRALGRCGATATDIAAAILWAVGKKSVKNYKTGKDIKNPYKADVINMSIGAPSGTWYAEWRTCPNVIQSAIKIAIEQGAILVVAAGNEKSKAHFSIPANCHGVITVGAVDAAGMRPDFSNYGLRIDIVAPGDAIYSTYNQGRKTPNHFHSYQKLRGTSMAAPYVTGVVALMNSVVPELTWEKALQYLQSSAYPFFSGSNCDNQTCGSGYLNAPGAVEQAMSDI